MIVAAGRRFQRGSPPYRRRVSDVRMAANRRLVAQTPRAGFEPAPYSLAAARIASVFLKVSSSTQCSSSTHSRLIIAICAAGPPQASPRTRLGPHRAGHSDLRSEEHTSELQSHSDLVCRLLLEKKKKKEVRTLIGEKNTTIPYPS